MSIRNPSVSQVNAAGAELIVLKMWEVLCKEMYLGGEKVASAITFH